MAGVASHDAQLMAQAASRVDTAVSEIKALQSRLAASHESLMGGWRGPAANTFTAAYGEFNVDFTKVLTALNNLGQKLRQSGVNYTTIEDANQSSANKIISALNG